MTTIRLQANSFFCTAAVRGVGIPLLPLRAAPLLIKSIFTLFYVTPPFFLKHDCVRLSPASFAPLPALHFAPPRFSPGIFESLRSVPRPLFLPRSPAHTTLVLLD